MLNWLLGSKPPSWKELDEIFNDYYSAAVYINKDDVINSIKVSDVDQFYSSASVLVQPKYLKVLRPIFIKFPKYIIIPTLSEKVYGELVSMENWRGYSEYIDGEFVGGWLLYGCHGGECKEKQYLHLQISELEFNDDKIVEYHKAVKSGNTSIIHEVLFRSRSPHSRS